MKNPSASAPRTHALSLWAAAAGRLRSSSSRISVRSSYWSLLLGALSVLPALGAWHLALPASSRIPYMPFFLSVLCSAWFLGFGAGMIATLLSALAVEYFIFPPALTLSNQNIFVHLCFIATGTLLSAVTAHRKSAQASLTELKEHLEGRIVERTRALEQQIEKQKAAENTLRQQALLLELSHDAIVVRGYRDRRVRFWNRAATELYGWTEKEATGAVVHDLLKSKYPEPLEEIEAQLQRFGRWDGEIIHTRKDGSDIIIESRWSPQRNSAGEPVAILELNSDITAKKQAEQRAQNSERLAALGTAAAVFAHEIANPLNGISTSLEIIEDELKKNTQLDADLGATFQLATKEIRRLSSLLDELRTFARPRNLNLERSNLVELIEEVLVPESAGYRAARIAISREYDRDLPPILLDEEKIKQVILNLCKNAADAMPEGGTLAIKTYRQEKAAILEIRDTGIGIPEGIDVFQLFLTTKPQGTGVGLPIVRQIIGAHRGKIEYVSHRDSGTIFKVTLPIRE